MTGTELVLALPRQTCRGHLERGESYTVGTLPSGETRPYSTEELEDGRRFHYCQTCRPPRECSVCSEAAVVRYVPVVEGLDPELGARCFEHRARSGELSHSYRIELGETVDSRPAPWAPIRPPVGFVAVKLGAATLEAEDRISSLDEVDELLVADLLAELRWIHPEHRGEPVGAGNVYVSVGTSDGYATLVAADGARDFDALLAVVREQAFRLAAREIAARPIEARS